MWKELASTLFVVVFLVSACSIAPLVGAEVSRVPGVNAGDWAKYTTSYHFITNDTNLPYYHPSYEDLEYSRMGIPFVAGSNVTFQILFHYLNGTEMTAASWVDVSTGATYYLLSQIGPVIAANLTVGDQVYLNQYSPVLNRTRVATYAGNQREINCLSMVQDFNNSYEQGHTNITFCWDRLSGIFVQITENVTMAYPDSGGFVHMEISWVISETNIWQPLPTITARVFITPRMINPRSRGKWIQAIIQLPAGINAKDVDPSTVRLNGTVPTAGRSTVVGRRWLIVKFDRSKVVSLILEKTHPGRFSKVTLTITGKLWSGSTFQGSDKIAVRIHRLHETFAMP